MSRPPSEYCTLATKWYDLGGVLDREGGEVGLVGCAAHDARGRRAISRRQRGDGWPEAVRGGR